MFAVVCRSGSVKLSINTSGHRFKFLKELCTVNLWQCEHTSPGNSSLLYDILGRGVEVTHVIVDSAHVYELVIGY